MSDIQIINVQPKYAAQIAQLQKICFPTLPPEERYVEDEILEVCQTFPDGMFVALNDDKVVGLGSGIYAHFDFDHPQHTLLEVTDQGHDPDGEWYYGLDISVHPKYRGKGIGRKLYEARKALVQRDNKRGIVAGGLTPGYTTHEDSMSIEDYVDKVCRGDLYDSTLSFQLNLGFEVRGMLYNYLSVGEADGAATLIVWENPHYTP